MTLIRYLKQWSVRHDKIAHFSLAFLLSIIDIKFAIGFMLAIECVQVDIYGFKKSRIKDTFFDLIADLLGIGVCYGILYLLSIRSLI